MSEVVKGHAHTRVDGEVTVYPVGSFAGEGLPIVQIIPDDGTHVVVTVEERAADVRAAYTEGYADAWRYRSLHPNEGTASDPWRETQEWKASRACSILGTNGDTHD